jgi:lysozyme
MSWLTSAIALTENFEGCQLTAYPDPGTGGAPYTVGFGATGPGIGPGTVWTQSQAQMDLLKRLTDIGAQIDQLVTVALTGNQKAALADFIYNVGAGNFRSSTLLRLLNAGNYAGASAQFAVWNLAAGHVMPGLVRRRAAEQALFNMPD